MHQPRKRGCSRIVEEDGEVCAGETGKMGGERMGDSGREQRSEGMEVILHGTGGLLLAVLKQERTTGEYDE